MAQSRQPLPEPTTTPAKDAPATKRRVVRVWYDDDTSVTVNPNRPRLLTNFEAEHGKETPETVAENMWLLWHALGRPEVSLDAWIDRIEEVEWLEVERGKALS